MLARTSAEQHADADFFWLSHPERRLPKRRIDAERFPSSSSPYLRTIVGRFLGHEHVVHVALALAGVGDPDEAGATAQFGEIRRSDIAHPGLQTAHQLFDIGGERSAMRYAALDSLGHQLALLDVALAVAVAHPLAHRAERSHSPIELVGPPLVENRFAGALFAAREQRSDHHGRGARRQRLHDVARE